MTNLSHTAGISDQTTIAFHEDVNREIHMTVSDLTQTFLVIP